MSKLNGEHRNLIDGELVAASNGETFDNINPATEEVIGQTADGTREDMERAVASARRAFDEFWNWVCGELLPWPRHSRQRRVSLASIVGFTADFALK